MKLPAKLSAQLAWISRACSVVYPTPVGGVIQNCAFRNTVVITSWSISSTSRTSWIWTAGPCCSLFTWNVTSCNIHSAEGINIVLVWNKSSKNNDVQKECSARPRSNSNSNQCWNPAGNQNREEAISWKCDTANTTNPLGLIFRIYQIVNRESYMLNITHRKHPIAPHGFL